MAESDRQHFLWCRTVKRACVKGQRLNGMVNGLFWPDGSVESRKDAPAIAKWSDAAAKKNSFPATPGMEAVQ
jgi:hypothetical protein